MNQKLMDVLTHPLKCKLLFEVHTCKQTTAKHLAEKFSDIPQATLYRYLKKMTVDEILMVVEQTPIRGVMERTYGVAIDLSAETAEIINNNSGEVYMQTFTHYMFGFMNLFQEYCSRDEIDILNDKSGFSLAPLYLNDDELETLATQIQEVIGHYKNNEAAPGRKLRSLGLIVSPPTLK